jgi:2-dehydropantoate 2-reductase
MSKSSFPKLSFLCFGVGAIGTYIGGSLALIGQKVVFVERPVVAAEVKKQGLHLRLKEKEFQVLEPEVVSSVEEALTRGPYDVAIFAVKSYDTQSALDGMSPYAVALPPFLSLQNGVENELRLAQVLGEDKVIAGTCTSAIGRRGAGDIVLERLRGIGIASDQSLTPTLVAVMQAAGLKARRYASAASMKWSKMLTNLLANASSAVLDMSPAAIFANPGLYWLEVQEYREALRVMEAQQIKVTDLPGTPVSMLSWLIKDFPPAFSRPLLVRSLGKGRGGKMPSFHIDLSSGRGVSEVDYLNGAVVRYGRRLGIPTPVNDCLNQTLQSLTRGEIPRGTFSHQPAKMLALIDPKDNNKGG